MALLDRLKQELDRAGKVAQDAFDDGKTRLEAFRTRQLADKALRRSGTLCTGRKRRELDAATYDRLKATSRRTTPMRPASKPRSSCAASRVHQRLFEQAAPAVRRRALWLGRLGTAHQQILPRLVVYSRPERNVLRSRRELERIATPDHDVTLSPG
jgi:hypothetical protein